MTMYRVARQDYQLQELTAYLAARPDSSGRTWQWTTDPEEALPLTQDEATRLAGLYNGIATDARHGMVARVEIATPAGRQVVQG